MSGDSFVIESGLLLSSGPSDASPLDSRSVIVTLPNDTQQLQVLETSPALKHVRAIKMSVKCRGVIEYLSPVTNNWDRTKYEC